MSELIYPGVAIATSEEVTPTSNSFEEDGMVYSAITGTIEKERHDAKITGKSIKTLAAGDLVYGVIENVLSPQMALVKFEPIEKSAITNSFAFLSISSVKKGYADSFSEYVKIGDYIKARVSEIKKLGIYLTTADPDLGVIKAFCGKCGKQMKQEQNAFKCSCGKIEKRKIPV
ncbi:MAG: exosome complex RNA-binding protein Csl4 [Candidatus Micrarchaeota archaeon]